MTPDELAKLGASSLYRAAPGGCCKLCWRVLRGAAESDVGVCAGCRPTAEDFGRVVQCLTDGATRRRTEALEKELRIAAALDVAVQYGGHDGGHHKNWVIDQMVRALTGCPVVQHTKLDCRGEPYTFTAQGESEEYTRLVADARDGEDGPETYSWDVGIPP